MASKRHRQRARRAAVQALYQWDMTSQSAGQIEDAMPDDSDLNTLDVKYFRLLIKGIPANVEQLDVMLEPGLDRSLDDVDPVERAVLRVACFELAHVFDVPWKVVIDEAVSAAKLFGSDNGYRFVNTVLDRMAEDRRTESITESVTGKS